MSSETDLRVALVNNSNPGIKAAVKKFSPNGGPDFDKIYAEGISIKRYSKQYGKVDTAIAIFKFIEYANNMLNVYSPMNKFQMDELTEDFMEEAEGYTMEDLAIFFLGIPKQQWGHINNRFDAAVVWELWDVYLRKRIDHFYNKEIAYKAGEEKAQPKRPGVITKPMPIGNVIEAKTKWEKDYKKISHDEKKRR